MSSSDDDIPLGMVNGNRLANGVPKSKPVIPASTDRALDKQIPSQRETQPGISIRNGPVDDMDGDAPMVNGMNGKRKSRGSITKNYKEESASEDDKPLLKRRRTSTAKARVVDSDSDVPLVARPAGKKPPKATETAIGESEDSDVPLGQKLTKQKASIEKAAEKDARAARRDSVKHPAPSSNKKHTIDDSDDDIPLKKKKRPSAATPAKSTPAKPTPAKSTSAKKHKLKKEESDDDVPLARKAPKKLKAHASATSTPAKKGKVAKKEDDEDGEDEEYRWWDAPMQGDGTTKWTTLEHNGVVFPPPYEPLPKNVKMRYEGVPLFLAPEAEEVAGFFGGMLNSTHNVENPTFQKNFFHDFQQILKETGGAKDKDGNKVPIKEFGKCDFKPIFEYYDAERERKKALPGAEKKAVKAEKDAAEAPYMFCMWDNRKQKVGNFRVEPPGLFRGRGEHPKTGHVKKRVQPEQITINIGKEAKVPPPPDGHRWKEVKHDNEGTWLAMWQENINGNYKYVMLAANTDIKGQSDYKKFEKARELKKHIDRIRKDYRKDLKAEKMADRQRATAIYLIDQFALRAGNEKGDDEADTVGCCSLKFEHVSLKPPNTVVFDFLGKDSIRFHEEFEVDPQVFKNLKIFKKAPKTEGDDIFDRLTTATLNKHLTTYMPGLTAKVFRTYNASYTMARLLREMKPGGNVHEMMKEYNDANRKVAILCNHKRTVGASHDQAMEKMEGKIKGVKYQRWRQKQMILDVDPKQKKKKGAEWFARDDDLDEEWIKEHQAQLVDEARKKIQKKFDQENQKLAADGKKEMKQKELNERLKGADELATKFKKENKTHKVEAEGKGPTVEKLEANIVKMDQRIENMAIQAEDKENNKEVALGTSKINYIDPRLSVVFSKKFNVPIEKIFSKTLRDKFNWAIKSVEDDWEF